MLIRPAILMLSAAMLCVAEDSAPLQEQPAPFSVWLDFPALSRPGASDPALPIWFEGLQTLRTPAQAHEPPKTLYRLRIRRLPSLQSEMLLRVFFDDLPDMQPSVSAWTETGKESFRSAVLGTGIGLSTSESVIVPLEGVDYVDVEVPGNGSNVRGTLAASLKEVSVLQTIDFRSAPEVLQPFGAGTVAPLSEDDRKLYGRIQAALDTGETRLSPDGKADSVYEFQLATAPLAAMVTFEILHADFGATPIVTINDLPPASANVHWPDLADPAYRGEARGDAPGLRFQYTGWLTAQVALPASALQPGMNKIVVGLSDSSGPIAIRNVELQLKQNWKHFDYILTPANR